MNENQFATVIIGGGQAGLTTAWHLTRHRLPCVILDENDKVGAAWRNRWDSLKLFTPARYSSLPGMPFPARPRSFPGKDDMSDYLRSYVQRFDLPVRNGVKVNRISFAGDRYIIETNRGQISAYNVIVATGAFHSPRIPEFAGTLDSDIVQMHSSQYQNPSQVRNGPVLVVGAGQSGAEIALDLAREHKVWLSGRDAGEQPILPGTLADRLFTPIMVFAATQVINVANPLGRKLRKYFFYTPHGIPRARGTKKRLLNAGVEWVERTSGTSEGYPQLENGRVMKVANVIWCTGFRPDYSWIDLPIFDKYGYPVHRRGVISSHPGLYFMGLPFQRTLSSPLIFGMGKDAGYIADHIASERADKKVQYSTIHERKVNSPSLDPA
jgi:putative flavoprotein involved in K+ transport